MKFTSLLLVFQPLQFLICMANSINYQWKQMDVKTAYLNAPIEEDVVIKQPEGVELFE